LARRRDTCGEPVAIPLVVDAQKPADVAEELGMSLAAVYQAKSRVLRRLHQQFGDLEGDG
jgi:DNA-directed RNA polymerase specialized sigma24 family protein